MNTLEVLGFYLLVVIAGFFVYRLHKLIGKYIINYLENLQERLIALKTKMEMEKAVKAIKK
jgi:hypothetical protein